ncbi:MAG TPA: glycosyltransferase [Acidimicrobiales bacterium]|nr:glycosyltransferase [Acidimicrobiales bacterium]
MLPLAKAFVDRGDEVAWATAAEAVPTLEREGFKVMVAGPGEGELSAEFARRFPEVQELPPPARPNFMFPRLFGAVRTGPTLADLLPLAQEWKPSLVVRDAAEFAGPIAAAMLGVPSVTHSFGSLLPEVRVAAAGEMVAPLWEAQGLEPRPFGGAYDDLYLDIFPPSLRTEDPAHVGTIQPLRAVTFATAGNEAVPDVVGQDSLLPLVYVTFGTVFNTRVDLIATVVRAVAKLPVRVVVTVGPSNDPAVLGDLPGNVTAARYIPQTALLPHCAAVVSHGGSGTFLAAISHGLPQLCLPQGADQFLNSAACTQSGVGITLEPGSVTSEGVQASVEQLLADPSFRSASERLRTEIEAMPAPDEVAAGIATHFLLT